MKLLKPLNAAACLHMGSPNGEPQLMIIFEPAKAIRRFSFRIIEVNSPRLKVSLSPYTDILFSVDDVYINNVIENAIKEFSKQRQTLL